MFRLTYTMVYDSQGGGEVVDSTLYEANAKATIKEAPSTVPEGKTFAKWNDAPDGTGYDYYPANA